MIVRSVPRLAVALGLLFGAAGSAAVAEPASSAPPVASATLAVLPVESLEPQLVDTAAIRAALLEALARHGVRVLPDWELDVLMERLRLRYTGGLSHAVARELHAAGIRGVLVTHVDRHAQADPPVLTLHARLVLTRADGARIGWMGSGALAGDENPGLLDTGVIHDPAALVARVAERLAGDAAVVLNGVPEIRAGVTRPRGEDRFRPRSLFVRKDAPSFGGAIRRVAVVPFTNESGRRAAGEIVALHITRELFDLGGFTVVEPGQVRQVLIDTRLVQEGGIAMAQADVLRDLLDVDLVVTGTVTEYLEAAPGRPPQVEFTVRGIDTRSRQVSWNARSAASGEKKLSWFGAGGIGTAHRLVAEMARALFSAVVSRTNRPGHPERRQPTRPAIESWGSPSAN